MLHLWRNPPCDGDNWIGFTSYRQVAKTSFVFRSKTRVKWTLFGRDIAGWGFHDVGRVRTGCFRGAAAQAEHCHPGIMALLEKLGENFGFEIPEQFFTDRYVLYANYWVMQKALFERYMEWSWPKVEWCLHHRNTNPFLGNPCPADFQAAALNGSDVRGKSAGYVMERLFIIWYMLNKVRINRLGPLLRF
jgi:hypothetical protein